MRNDPPRPNQDRRIFSEGAMWEGPIWELHVNKECSGLSSAEPCRHCHSDHVETRPGMSGSWGVRVWICPRVVVGLNEGGYATTGICLDCILNAAKTRMTGALGLKS